MWTCIVYDLSLIHILDPSLFEGLHISKNAALCERYMGKYPVIAISLKGVDAASYQEAVVQLVELSLIHI